MSGSEPAPPPFAAVAVPLPVPYALTYAVPERLGGRVAPGIRVRVRVGRRKVLGLVTSLPEAAPDGVSVKPIEGVVDQRPVLPPALLALADFTADYYLAPIGEVVRAMLPADLEPWGDRRVWLTDAGALAIPRDDAEADLVEALRGGGRIAIADLELATGRGDLAPTIERMRGEGRLVVGERGRRGSRYAAAVELAAGSLDELRELCGRSRPGREVVELLAALGRPATLREITAEVGCGDGVVRRLVELGVLRRFTQVERLELEHHLLPGGEARRLELREDQRRAVEPIRAAIARREFGAFLLAGIAGAGKTEVYLRAAASALQARRGVILLVPEIALVPALAGTLRQRFGERAAILHSALSKAERRQEWERIREREARVVLGPRSAIFAPVSELGLVVVDEEQDGSYKQDSTPRYNARDLALVRARHEGAVAVVVSATPSLETRHNVELGKLRRLELTTRVGQGSLPEGILVDLRGEKEASRRPGEVTFSECLRAELDAAFAAGHQVILLRNRRGYSPILLCRACGEDHRCDECGLPRTYHRRLARLLCHYCGSRRPIPQRCDACGEEALEPIGAGTERVEEVFGELYPGIPVGVLDRDTVRRPGSVAAVLERFRNGETRALIGTQMVSKGHHFPRVALTAVLAADTYLGFPDFRAVERTYILLTQLAGRAGRGEHPGKVVIQTFHPDHYAIRAALDHDDAAFAAEEMRFRRIFHYPPYTRMIQLLLRDRDRERAARSIGGITEKLSRHPLAAGVRLSGPAPAPFERLRGRWRFQLLLRSASARRLRELVSAVVAEPPPPELTIDVDPYELL